MENLSTSEDPKSVTVVETEDVVFNSETAGQGGQGVQCVGEHGGQGDELEAHGGGVGVKTGVVGDLLDERDQTMRSDSTGVCGAEGGGGELDGAGGGGEHEGQGQLGGGEGHQGAGHLSEGEGLSMKERVKLAKQKIDGDEKF